MVCENIAIQLYETIVDKKKDLHTMGTNFCHYTIKKLMVMNLALLALFNFNKTN